MEELTPARQHYVEQARRLGFDPSRLLLWLGKNQGHLRSAARDLAKDIEVSTDEALADLPMTREQIARYTPYAGAMKALHINWLARGARSAYAIRDDGEAEEAARDWAREAVADARRKAAEVRGVPFRSATGPMARLGGADGVHHPPAGDGVHDASSDNEEEVRV